MKRTIIILVLSTMLAHNTAMHALTFKTCAKACASVVAAAAVGAVAAKGIAAHRNKMDRKRNEWINNFISMPLLEPCTPLELRLAIDEMKRMLTVLERLQLVRLFLHVAHEMRTTPEEAEKGLRATSRALDILRYAFTQEEIDANDWIRTAQLHISLVSVSYIQEYVICDHNADDYASSFAQLDEALVQAMRKEDSFISYVTSGGTAICKAVQSHAGAIKRAVHAGVAKIVA